MAAKHHIDKTMTIDSIFSKFPEKGQKLAQEMTNQGLHCVGCGASTWETLEAGMLGHGFSEEAVDELVKRLNAILEEPVDYTTITMTQRAAEKFKEIARQEKRAGSALRFGDHPGGCGGFEYILDFSDSASDKDEIFTAHGVEIHVEKAAVSRLLGSQIDYVDGLKGGGFKVTNPNVKGSCSCGSSQNY